MRARTTTARACQGWLGGLALSVLVSVPAHADPPVAVDAVEAAYLHKFPAFVDWPADSFRTATSPIVIGVAGAPRVLEELTRIARGRLVLGRVVEARAVSGADVPMDVHVLFVGRQDAAGAKAMLDAAARGHILTVTDVPEGLKAGAILDFVQIDSRLRFEASLIAAHRADLRLSSKLLSVASRVVEEAP